MIFGYIRYSDVHQNVRRSGLAFDIDALQNGDMLFHETGGDAFWYDTQEGNEAT